MHVKIDHPCVQHKLALIRNIETGHKKFRELATEITEFVCYEALKNVNTREVEVQTPIEVATCRMIDHDIVVVPVLRAGIGMLEGILELVPTARVGFVGLYRDEETKLPVAYYERFPPQAKSGTCIIIDPMLATGGSAVATVDILKLWGVSSIKFVGIIGAPEGIENLNKHHPEVMIHLAAVDEKLNERGYILPGLGDAGDRQFGTG